MTSAEVSDRETRAAYYRDHGLWTDERLGWLVFDVAAATPDRELYCLGDERYTYGQIADWAAVFGAALLAQGVQRGDRVLIQLPNQIEALVAQIACFRIGAVDVPVIPIYREHEMAHIIRDSRPSAVVSTRQAGNRLPTSEIDGILAASGLDAARFCVGDGVDGWTCFPGLPDSAGAALTLELTDPLEADQCALILYTSGTTSAPKGVQISSRSFVSNARVGRSVLGLSAHDVFFVCSPLSHLAGFVAGVLWPATFGARAVIMPKWNGPDAAALIEREGATFTTAAAVFLHDLLEVYRSGAHSAHRLTRFMSGGAPTPPAMVREAHSLGVFAFRGYGMTETGGGVCWGGPNESLDVCADTDGRVVPGSQIQAVDLDRRPVPYGQEGELRVRGPQNMIGYTDPELTAAAVDEDDWVYTGDLGTVTVDGLIRITGRTKDIINRGGEKFSAREIEELILSHPSIQDAAVVGLSDARLGERVGAFVTLKPDEAWIGDEALAQYLRESRLALQKIPTEWVVLDALPRTASGKIQKHVLRSFDADRTLHP